MAYEGFLFKASSASFLKPITNDKVKTFSDVPSFLYLLTFRVMDHVYDLSLRLSFGIDCLNVPDDGPVTIPPIDHALWPLARGYLFGRKVSVHALQLRFEALCILP